MKHVLSKFRLTALIIANVIAFAFIAVSPGDAVTFRGDVDACNEGPGVGCGCLAATPFTPAGCYESGVPGQEDCWSEAGCVEVE